MIEIAVIFDRKTCLSLLSAPLFGIFDARKISRVSLNPLPRGQEEARNSIFFYETTQLLRA